MHKTLAAFASGYVRGWLLGKAIGVTALLVWLALSSGCATSGNVGAGIQMKGNGSGSDAAKKTVPAEVVGLYPDGAPASNVKLRAIDASERVYDVPLNDAGRSNVPVWSDQMVLWRALALTGEWIPVPPARVYKADGKKNGIRFVLTIPKGEIQ